MKTPAPIAKAPETTPYVPPGGLNTVLKDDTHEVCLEQYKAYIGDLGNIGTRYETAQGFYVSVITALISVLALAESNKILSPLPTSTLVVVCLFATALCIVWALTIRFYRKLFGAKFAVLNALEANLAYKCFAEEHKALVDFDEESKQPRHKPLLTQIDIAIPIMLSLFFVALGLIKLLGY